MDPVYLFRIFCDLLTLPDLGVNRLLVVSLNRDTYLFCVSFMIFLNMLLSVNPFDFTRREIRFPEKQQKFQPCLNSRLKCV